METKLIPFKISSSELTALANKLQIEVSNMSHGVLMMDVENIKTVLLIISGTIFLGAGSAVYKILKEISQSYDDSDEISKLSEDIGQGRREGLEGSDKTDSE